MHCIKCKSEYKPQRNNNHKFICCNIKYIYKMMLNNNYYISHMTIVPVTRDSTIWVITEFDPLESKFYTINIKNKFNTPEIQLLRKLNK